MSAHSTAGILELAEQHFAAGRLHEAEPLFRRVLGISGDDARVLHYLGYIARGRGDLHAAEQNYTAATLLEPDNAQLHNNLAEVQHTLGQHEAAVKSYRRAATLAPDEAVIALNVGKALRVLHREEEAVEWLRRATSIRADLVEARSEICPALCSLGRYEEALAEYRLAIELQPDNWNARYLEALALVALGDWENGWEKHEARWRAELGAAQRRVYPQPYWLGEPIEPGQTILLHAEQGLGDVLQFVRYAPMVAERGARVLLEVHASLVPLVGGMPGVTRAFAIGETPPPFDLHSSLMSMPRAFRTTLANVPAEVPYLSAPDQHVGAWRERIGTSRKRRIGIAWSGTASPWNRAIPLAMLAPLAMRPDCELHVLQTEIWPEDRATLETLPQIWNHSASLKDFADTAALATLMDMVISIDTAAAHLAGALGKPAWVLLPVGPDYRWMLERTDCPWYPTMRLFRQTELNRWEPVIATVTRELDALA